MTGFVFSVGKLVAIGVKYYIVHMYSMPYYTYGIYYNLSTANYLVLEPTALYIYQKNSAARSSSVSSSVSLSEHYMNVKLYSDQC